MKIYRLLCLWILLVVCASCSDSDEVDNQTAQEVELTEIIKAGKLLLDVQKTSTETLFLFEDATTYFCSLGDIEKLKIEKEQWRTMLKLKGWDNELSIPTLGDKLNINVLQQVVNPSGYAPLSAQVILDLPVDCYIKMEILSNDTKYPSYTHLFDNEYSKRHNLDIHGLYENQINTILLHMTDRKGTVRATDKIELKTEPIQFAKPTISLEISKLDKIEEGMTLISYVGDHEYDTSRPFMIDHAGQIRWALDLKKHPQLQNFAACTGLKRLKNGNFMTASIRNGYIYELDMFGTLINSWSIDYPKYDFHRDIIELPNDNFVLAVTKAGSTNKKGEYAILDYMIEVDRETGKVVTEWDFKESMEEERADFSDKYTTADWAHQNGIAYSAHDHSIITSHRYQGVVKVDWKNNTKWILSPHKGWSSKRSALLDAVTTTGTKLDADVQQGYKSSPDFDWAWAPHCPYIVDENRVLLFDNGYYRHFSDQSQQGYSRAVEYRINEADKTVVQTWEFGKQLGIDGYSSIVSSVQYLHQKNNVLFASGAIGFKGHNQLGQGGGRIIEVDYQTKEIVFDLKMQVNQFYIFHRATRMPLYPMSIQ